MFHLPFQEELNHWKKSGNNVNKVKYTYKSAEDIVKAGRNKKISHLEQNRLSKTKVIDMTGPETRVLSSYHAITGNTALIDSYLDGSKNKFDKFNMPELISNIQLLIDMSEEEILRTNKRKEQDHDRLVHIEHEKVKLSKLVNKGRDELDDLTAATERLEKLENLFNQKLLTLDEAGKIFKSLYDDFREIYVSYGLSFLGPHYLTHLLKDTLSHWNPLAHPKQLTEIYSLWQELLEGTCGNNPDQIMDPYHQLCYDTWFSFVKGSVQGPWEPKEPGPLVLLLHAWSSLMPPWIIQVIVYFFYI